MPKTRTVLIELEKAGEHYRGLGQFCLHFAAALLKQASLSFKPIFWLKRPECDLYRHEVKCAVAHSFFRYFPWFGPKVDLWHATDQTTRFWPSPSAKYLLTVHDLNFLYYKKPHKHQKYLRRLQKKIDRADAITAISQYVADDLAKHCSLGNKKVRVIYNGVAQLDALKQEVPGGLKSSQVSKFFFCLGLVGPSKNQEVLIPAMKSFPDYHLILAGPKSAPYEKKLRQLASKFGVSDRILFLGVVSELEKVWLYQHCEALLQPALTEGFCLPVIEAMQFGKPVFLSKATALPEIGGKEAYYFNSLEAESIQKVLFEGLEAYSQDASKAERLKAWAKQFSWHRAISQYLSVYQQLL